MRQFNNVLLVANSRGITNAVVQRAAALAIVNSAKITIAAVVGAKAPELSSGAWSSELERLSVKEVRDQIGGAAKAFRARGLRVSTGVLKGTAFVEIVRKVVRDEHDLVMLSDDDGRGFKTKFLGSTALHLVRKCPCPVWVVKSKGSAPYSRILAAVDPTAADQGKTSLNRRILELAVSLTEAERGRLQVVHAWTLYGERILRGTARIPKPDVDKLLVETRKAHKAKLGQLLEPFGLASNVDPRPHATHGGGNWKNEPGSLAKTRVHLLKGQPADVITSLVRKERIEVIVMGTTCRTGVNGFLIGSTAETVLSQVDCSVLTVKPSGFVSPVSLE